VTDPRHRRLGTAAVFTRGIRRIPHLEALLGADRIAYKPRDADAGGVDAVVGWGEKRNTRWARAYAGRHGLPYVGIEDGFLRSVGLGVEGDPPLSLVLDRRGIYYDATRASELEEILAGDHERSPLLDDPELIARARGCIDGIVSARLSKYNSSPACPAGPPSRNGGRRILVVDQTRNDQSIRKGLVPDDAFPRMLAAALTENPDAEILIKTHPDVIAGKRAGNYPASHADPRVTVTAEPVNPIYLLEQVDRVYTATSQLGFEALMAGLPVTCFGAPFYAGWGVTDDRVAVPRRDAERTVEQIFAAAYILYPSYVSPDTGEPTEIEEIIDHLARQRRMFELNAGTLYCVGFSLWKRNYVRSYLRSPGNRVVFVDGAAAAEAKGFDSDARLIVWGLREDDGIRRLCDAHGVPLWRMEDGFLRSIGLGSDLTAPASLVVDRTGIYYDPSGPSDLERILEEAIFTPDDLERAARLRERIVSLNVSKYNVDADKGLALPDVGDRRVILVPGQVEDDASIRRGCADVRTNLALLEEARKAHPGGFVMFKTHPDVVSGNRQGRVPAERAAELADLVVEEAPIGACLDAAHEVHTMTSLVGFEALLRGLEVTTYGRPFYAGFGLTRDRHPVDRRTRRLTLDELVAATLIHYPRYVNAGTRHFTTPEAVVARLVAERERDAGKTTARTSRQRRALRKLYHVVKGILNA
jgi:capsular polysaccharide export protein